MRSKISKLFAIALLALATVPISAQAQTNQTRPLIHLDGSNNGNSIVVPKDAVIEVELTEQAYSSNQWQIVSAFGKSLQLIGLEHSTRMGAAGVEGTFKASFLVIDTGISRIVFANSAPLGMVDRKGNPPVAVSGYALEIDAQ